MKKMIEVFKQSKKVELKQRVFLFFLTRVLLIRLNSQVLTESLRKLWPHLLNELICVFEVDKEQMKKDKDNENLTIEAIKLVELLSSLNIEDFQMNQWIFLIDGYGMNYTTKNQSVQGNPQSLKMSNELNKAKSLPVTSKKEDINLEVFKTFIVRFIGDIECSFYNVKKPQDGTKNLQFQYDDTASGGRDDKS